MTTPQVLPLDRQQCTLDVCDRIHEVSILVETRVWYTFWDPRGPRKKIQDCHVVIPTEKHLIEMALGQRKIEIVFKDIHERALVSDGDYAYPDVEPSESYITIELLNVGVLVYVLHQDPQQFVPSDCMSAFEKMVDAFHITNSSSQCM